ncbi:MAG: type II secretion system F family protein, partial [Deltaproteobacteria bacterium]
MDLVSLLPWAVFAAFACGAWALINFLANKNSRADERLEALRNPLLRAKDKEKDKTDDPRAQSGVGTMMERAAPTLSKALQPKSELEQSKLKVSLANAGFNSPYAPEWYLAIKFASLIGGLVLGAGVGLAQWGMTRNGIFAVVVGGGLGFYLPEIVLFFLRKGRQEKIFLSLPDALDLLVVCVE